MTIALALLAALAAAIGWLRPGATDVSPSHPSVSVALDLGPDVVAGTGSAGPSFILSPDGTRIVFVSTDVSGVRRLATRVLDDPTITPLPGTVGASAPFFSPDGEWVGFFAAGKLKKLRLAGGEPVTLCDAPAGRGGSWSDDGKIIAALDTRTALKMVPVDGGTPTRVTRLKAGELGHRWPHFLPGGKVVLFMVTAAPANHASASIGVLDLARNVQKIGLAKAGMAPRYLPTGHLAYVSKGTLHVVPFDLDRQEVHGAPIPVLEGIASDPVLGSAQLDVSSGGTMAYLRGTTSGLRVLEWLDSTGRSKSMGLEPAYYQMPRVSPDGSRIVYELNDQGATSDVWVYDWQRGTRTKLTDGSDVNSSPVWTPDGQYVVFHSVGRLFWRRADGASPTEPLIAAQKGPQFPGAFTPDGKRFAFYEVSPDRGSLIQTAPVDISAGTLRVAEPVAYRHTTSNQAYPAFSPDGRWMAYTSTDSGGYDVYVRGFPDTGRQWPISTGGGTLPVWSRTANELWYRSEDLRLMVVPYAVEGDTFVAGRPRVWSDRRLHNLGLTGTFDLAPDGKRVAAVFSAEAPQPAPKHVTLMLNFFDEVRRRATFSGR